MRLNNMMIVANLKLVVALSFNIRPPEVSCQRERHDRKGEVQNLHLSQLSEHS